MRTPKASRKGRGSALLAGLLLSATAACLFPSAQAIPGEPTVQVRIEPTEVEVDASGVNAVDTSFVVNITGSNLGLRDRMMWVNISFGTSPGWKVVPLVANLTLTLAPQEEETQTVSVTVTVPPKVSANVEATFFARYEEENDLRVSSGMTGNATAQIGVRPVFGTSAEFANGTAAASVRQGEDANISVRVTNRGNGDFRYDGQLLNAAELRPNDIVLQSTTPADVAQNGTAVVRFVIHANRAAIAGTYALQIRVLAVEAPAPPPAGAFADLIAQLTVTPSAPPPPPTNNTTPPPPANNTTNPPVNPPPTNPSAFEVIFNTLRSPLGMAAAAIFAAVAVIGGLLYRSSRRAKQKRAEALERARMRRQGAPAPAGMSGRPAGPQPPPRGPPVRPVPVKTPLRPGGPSAPQGPPTR